MDNQYIKIVKQPMFPWEPDQSMELVSISSTDVDNGSPKAGDMIAYNPNDPTDMWLVSGEFFKHNYALAEEVL